MAKEASEKSKTITSKSSLNIYSDLVQGEEMIRIGSNKKKTINKQNKSL